MKGSSAIWISACCAVVMSCAAASTKAAMPAPSSSSGGASPAPADRHAEIAQLDQAIDAELAKRGLPPAAEVTCAGGCSTAAATSMSVAPTAAEDTTCKPGPSDTCKDSCTLSDSICANAGKICDIARQLGSSDAYANDTCAKGKTSCETARARCCRCQL